MRAILGDVAYALRTLRKNRGFALTAIVTLALGIGATTAIFSVVNAVLLKPLPYGDPDRLVRVVQDMRNRNVQDFPIAPGDFFDLREQVTMFEGLRRQTGRALQRRWRSAEQFRHCDAEFSPSLPRFGQDFDESDGTPPVPNN
jgi:putative ABC transport system permease protein